MNESNAANLPYGVCKLALKRIEDTRGSLIEVFRAEWFPDAPPAVQWNVSVSRAGTLRGFHVHWEHHDFISALTGQLHLGLQDMRPWSPTYELATMVTIEAGQPALISIPPGVGHAFWYDQDTTHIYGVSHYWNMHDELTCHWDDKNIKVPWPFTEPKYLSEKDRISGSFDQMQASLLTHLCPPASEGKLT